MKRKRTTKKMFAMALTWIMVLGVFAGALAASSDPAANAGGSQVPLWQIGGGAGSDPVDETDTNAQTDTNAKGDTGNTGSGQSQTQSTPDTTKKTEPDSGNGSNSGGGSKKTAENAKVSLNYALEGPVYTLIATLRNAGASSAKGSIRFSVDGETIATVSMKSGRATYEWTPAKAGAYTLTATYVPGDGDAFTGAKSSGLKVTVSSPGGNAAPKADDGTTGLDPADAGTEKVTDTVETEKEPAVENTGNSENGQGSDSREEKSPGDAGEEPKDESGNGEDTAEKEEPVEYKVETGETGVDTDTGDLPGDSGTDEAENPTIAVPFSQRRLALAGLEVDANNLGGGDAGDTGGGENGDGGNGDADDGENGIMGTSAVVAQLSLAASENEGTYTLTATITNAGGTSPSGNIEFRLAGNLMDTKLAASGSATIEWTPTSDGEYTWTATYIPGESDEFSTGTVEKIIKVGQQPSGKDLANCEVTVNGTYAYTGSVITPDVTVKDDDVTLTADTHYTVSASNSANAGKVSATIKGVDNSDYAGTSKTFEFTIEKKDIAGCTVDAIPEQTHTGNPITPEGLIVKNGDVPLVKDTDYSVAYVNNTDVGQATITLTGMDPNYTGTKDVNFAIVKAEAKDLNDNLQITVTDPIFTGKAVEPEVEIKDGAKTLVKGTDYTVTTNGAISVSDSATAKVILQGIGDYKGTVERDFSILAKDIAGCTPLITNADYQDADGVYYFYATSESKRPNVGVLDTERNERLNYPQEFGVSGDDDIKDKATGTYSITVTGASNYTGTKIVQYKIANQLTADFSIEKIPNQVYTGQKIEPKPVVKKGSTVLTEGTDYTLSYRNNVNVGNNTAVVTVAGKGQYAGTLEAAFTITKATPTISLVLDRQNNDMIIMATVAGNTSPTGSIRMTLSTTGYGGRTVDVPLSGNTATYKLENAASGYYSVTAYYLGDANHYESAKQTVAFRVPNVYLQVSGGWDGNPASITVTVTGVSGGGQPTGKVVLYADGSEIATLTLTNGTASYYWRNPPRTGYTLKAVYQGDNNYPPTTSNTVTFNDYSGQAAPSVKLTATTSSSSTRVTLKATVTGNYWLAGGYPGQYADGQYKNGVYGRYVQPSGRVDFYEGRTYLGSAIIEKGVASFTWKNVSTGKHTVTAIYQGDRYYRPATATTEFTRKAVSSSGGGSSSSQQTTNTTQGTDNKTVILRDENGSTVESYVPANLQMVDGVLTLSSNRTMNTYSYGIGLTQMRDYASRSDGYFKMVTPSFNVDLPFGIATTMTGLSEYITQNNLTAGTLELRLIIKKLDDGTMDSLFNANNANDSAASAFYRVELALYNANGTRLDYEPEMVANPLRLIIQSSEQIGSAQYYDETDGAFYATTVDFTSTTAAITVSHNGIYVLTKPGK